MARDIFISYSSQDQGAATAACSFLEHRGIECWMAPRDVSPGHDYAEALVNAISDCQALVLIFSSHSNNSNQVRREVERAVSTGKVILPVRIEDVAPSNALEYFIGNTHWLDAIGPPLEAHFGKLATSVENVLGLRALGKTSPDNLERALADQLANQLEARRLEDIGKSKVSGDLRSALSTIISELPGRLDRVAQQANQILSLQDAERRLESNEAALRVLSGIQSELHDQGGILADMLNGITAKWSSLFRADRDAAEAMIEGSREIENPFICGNPVRSLDAGLFTGRRDVSLEIERNILRATQMPTLLLYGQRRMGKTSILHHLPTLLGPGFLTVLVDCQAPPAVESQRSLLRHLSLCLASALNLRLSIQPSDQESCRTRGAVPLSLDTLREDAFSIFEDWLDAFQARLPEDTHVLLCLDEFERLKEIIAAGWGARFLDALRHWLQHRPRFALMFIGSHTFEQLGPAWTDRFLSARRLKVSFLGAEDIRQLLTRPTPTFRLKYAPGTLDVIISATHGQPFLTQSLAFELVQRLNREHRKEATTSDVEAAINDMLESCAEYFVDFWSSRTDEERALLREVARGNVQPPVTAVALGLRDYDVLDASGEFAVPLVRRWVERNQLRN